MSSIEVREERGAKSVEPGKKVKATTESSVVRGENGLAQRWDQSLGFLTDVRNEMRKVTTPTRPEVQTTTIVVIITVFAFAAYFYVVDLIIGTGLDKLLHKLTTH